MSATAAAFVAESAPSREATGTRPDRTDTGTADTGMADPSTTGTRTTGARLPRAALLAGAAVVVAALIGGAFLVGRAGGDDTRRSSAKPDAIPGTAGTAGPYDSTPSLLGPPPASVSPSASRSVSPSTDAADASSPSSATGSAKDGRATTRATPSADSAKDTGTAGTGSGGDGGDGSSCVSAKGSGALTDYSVCVSSGTLVLRVTFHRSQPFYHAFFNTDGDRKTGYQLPYPSPSALGADYMIENGSLYRSRATDWSWTETETRPKHTVSGSTQTWTLPLSGIGAPTGTQQLEFNAGSDYTPVLTFSPK
ncbi:hypothetical protein AB0M32_39730 [Streptomyces sp. NPDC051985]|uniref:hypothetical protein n=1 Tax=Streptomyces sp. NPDC051985 TaxID=3155807 RepID=UPI00342DAA93